MPSSEAESKNNRRRYLRFPMAAQVEIVQPGHGTLYLTARDMNQVSAFFEAHKDETPAIGGVIFPRIEDASDAHRPDIIKARVVRQTDDGIGVHFET
ncbi:MAG TPA: PilZ domain-containing protein [Chromatiales bacterium]|jgi:hypothetical protein|nr:PilZ domain-containing protein [Chromatiales bacterium]HIO54090.1 PilZ domain-containing protein [Chromatiales bacterium]